MSESALTVALVSTQRQWHGGEEQARLLAEGLRRRGCRVAVLARRDGELIRRMSAEGFETVAFGGNGRNPAALWTIRRALKRIRPDVLHYNDPHAASGAGLAALGLPIPLRVAARRVAFPIRSPRTYRWFADVVICVSRDTRRVCAAGGIPEPMLRVVHDGVEPARIAAGDRKRGRDSLGIGDGQTLLLCVAALNEAKGHEFLLDAMPAVVARHPNVMLALAGDGHLRETLQRQVEQQGLSGKVKFLGYRHDVPDLIHAADLFVLPSRSEGLCSTLIDAMLARCPIVATTAGGIPDLLGEGPAGEGPAARLVPPCDSRAIAEAILAALAEPDKSGEYVSLAAVRAAKFFTADRMVDDTLAVYREGVRRR
jgi:glycosyltransferase involved in cell wall biosynthesis